MQTVDAACVMFVPGRSQEDSFVGEDDVIDACADGCFDLLCKDHVANIVD